jgi:hypothetical protein
MSPSQAIAVLEQFSDPEAEHELDRLEGALAILRDGSHIHEAVRPLLGIFERFPTHDGFGMFWSILHALESAPGSYEAELIHSLRRGPSEFGVMMVNRMLSAGHEAVDGVALVHLLREVARRSDACEPVRTMAEEYAQMHAAG